MPYLNPLDFLAVLLSRVRGGRHDGPQLGRALLGNPLPGFSDQGGLQLARQHGEEVLSHSLPNDLSDSAHESQLSE
jgi:hypothetical protein